MMTVSRVASIVLLIGMTCFQFPKLCGSCLVWPPVQVQMLGLCAVMVIFVQLQWRWNLAGTGTKLELECDGIISTQQWAPPLETMEPVAVAVVRLTFPPYPLKSSIRRFVITGKAPTRAFSWLKAATTAFTFKTLLRHYAKRALTPRSLNVKLGPRRNYHKERAAIRHYANQPNFTLRYRGVNARIA